MDMVGLLATVLWFVVLVGIGVVWSTPEKAYAPTTDEVDPAIVTTMFPVPLGFVRYQNSASLLENEDILFVSGTPPNVTETTLLLFASTPTTSKLLVPDPALKLESVIWYGADDTVPDVVLTLFSTMEPDVVADAVLDNNDKGFTEMASVGNISKIVKRASMLNTEYGFFTCPTILSYS
jgi:hypothetical protein